MNPADEARANALPCEMVKYALRQTKDGIVVSFVVHPNDIPAALQTSHIGSRWMAALVQIGDDEQAVRDAAPPSQPDTREALELADHDEIGRKVFSQPWEIQKAIVTIAAHCTAIRDQQPTGEVADLAACISHCCDELATALAALPPDAGSRKPALDPATVEDIQVAEIFAALTAHSPSCDPAWSDDNSEYCLQWDFPNGGTLWVDFCATNIRMLWREDKASKVFTRLLAGKEGA